MAEARDTFARLLDEMPRIAKAVNAFSSPDVQRSAFAALVATLGVAEDTADEPTTELASEAGTGQNGGSKVKGTTPRKRKARPAKASAALRNFDFSPQGKQSFRDFVAEKQPTTNIEKNMVALFWLEQIDEVSEINMGHVVAAFKDRGWNEPANHANSLQVLASTKNWIDTTNMKDLKLSPTGRNSVKEMPRAKPAAKKK